MSTDSQDPLRDATDTSRVIAAGAGLLDLLASRRNAIASWLANAYSRSTFGKIKTAYPASGLHRFATGVWHTARRSWLYRWLTTEPDPEVIVIDLRETWAVGPLLILLERVLVPLERGISSATSSKLACRATNHPVPLASAALLGVLIVSLVQTWPANPVVLAAYAIGFVAAGLGLTVADSRTALANSPVVSLLVAVLEPPETPTDEGQT